MECILQKLNMVKKQHMNSENRRIDWCDIFKGILITLVAIGHATGKFNFCIYQFHIAAFFYISGYTTTVQGRSVFQEFIKLTYKLIIPYISINVAGLWMFWIFDKINILHFISTTQYPASFQDALSAFFVHGTVYCDWLGAMWFLPVLFGAGILFRVMVRVSKNVPVLLSASILLFILTVKFNQSGAHISQWLLLSGIAQVFLIMGYCWRKTEQKFFRNSLFTGSRWIPVKIVLIGIVWYSVRMLGLNHTVDWPSRRFNGLIDLILPVCGIIMTVNVSKLFSHIKHVKSLFTYLGKNSMGIMCFHFMGFKTAYFTLILLRRMQLVDLYRLVPGGTEIEKYWLILTVMGICFSVCLWKLLHKHPVTKYMIGGANASNVCEIALNTTILFNIRKIYIIVLGIADESINQYLFFLKKKYNKFVLGIFIYVIIMLSSIPLIKLYSNSKIEVVFPYYKNEVVFFDGWLPQNNEEEYRWFLNTAKFETILSRHTKLEIKGYIPENVNNISYIRLKINGKEIYYKDVTNEKTININIDISEQVKYFEKNIIELETDGSRIPSKPEDDQRSFSAFIESICIM